MVHFFWYVIHNVFVLTYVLSWSASHRYMNFCLKTFDRKRVYENKQNYHKRNLWTGGKFYFFFVIVSTKKFPCDSEKAKLFLYLDLECNVLISDNEGEENLVDFVTEKASMRVLRQCPFGNVEHISNDFSGHKLIKRYKYKCHDGRKEKKGSRTSSNSFTAVHYRSCSGRHSFWNTTCPFLVQFAKQNCLCFGKENCFKYYSASGIYDSDNAQQCNLFSDDEQDAFMYHCGNHTSISEGATEDQKNKFWKH